MSYKAKLVSKPKDNGWYTKYNHNPHNNKCESMVEFLKNKKINQQNVKPNTTQKPIIKQVIVREREVSLGEIKVYLGKKYVNPQLTETFNPTLNYFKSKNTIVLPDGIEISNIKQTKRNENDYFHVM